MRWNINWAWQKLQDSGIFPLTQEELAGARERYRPQIKGVTQGSIALLQGTTIDRLYYALEGSFSAEMPDNSGKVLKVETLRAPSLVASGLLFTEENRLPVQLRAESEGCLVSFSKKECLSLMGNNAAFLEYFLLDMGNKIAFLAEKLRMQQFSSLKQKVAAYFLKQAKLHQSSEIRLHYTLDTLADLFGVSRPSLSRSLAEMIREGYLEKRAPGQYKLEAPALQSLLG
jgi:CRP-like cAMP-binding protein